MTGDRVISHLPGRATDTGPRARPHFRDGAGAAAGPRRLRRVDLRPRRRDPGSRHGDPGLDRDAWSVVVFFGFAPAAIVRLAFGRRPVAPQPGDHDRIVATYPETSEAFRERVRVRAESQRSGTNR